MMQGSSKEGAPSLGLGIDTGKLVFTQSRQ